MQTIFWLILFVVLVVIEIATLGLTTIWFAGGSIIAFILALKGLTGSQIVRTLVFTVAFVLVTFIMAIAEFAAVSSI